MTAEPPRKDWTFYGRESELDALDAILDRGRWFFCAISGRRRIGKTSLVLRALERARGRQEPFFYVQIPDSDERGVVQTFQDALEDRGLPEQDVRDPRSFGDIARLVGTLCRRGVVVILDEFQYFHRASLSRFTSLLQAQVDGLRDTRAGGLFVLGSLHTEMTAVLEDRRSPLFNRVTDRVVLPHWDFATLFEMFASHGIDDPRQRLFLWSLFEGVPKFHRDAWEAGVMGPSPEYRRETLRRLFFEGTSPLRDEAANWFLGELRGGYETILRIVARKGPCPVARIRDEYGRAGPAGAEQKSSAYLAALVDRYQMVCKLQPVFTRPGGRKARYALSDNFLAAWLAALGRAAQAARVQPVDRVVVQADARLEGHEGRMFEKMVRRLTEECSRRGVGDFPITDVARGYWNKADGADIEVDLVALDEDREAVRFGSCKRGAEHHTGRALTGFAEHVEAFLRTKEGRRLAGWKQERALYAPAFPPDLRRDLEGAGWICRDLGDFDGWLAPDRGLRGRPVEPLA